MRRPVVIVSLLVCSLLVTAVALAGEPRFEQKRLRPADMALAKRTTLRVTDLRRGWLRAAPQKNPKELPTCPGVDMDFSAFTVTGRATTAFQQRGARIDSHVEVFESRSDASRDFRKANSDPVARCLGRWLREELAKSAPNAKVISTRLLSRPRVGEQGMRYRLVMDVPIAGRPPARFFIDQVAFQRGRTIVSLVFTAPTEPLIGELTIARLVAARAR